MGEYAFPGPLRDRLVAAILAGEKTSTSSLLLEYRLDGEPLPQPGDREVVVDSDGNPVCLTEVSRVDVTALAEVTLEHVLLEGEGFRTVAEWRAGHERFWHSDDFRASVGDPDFTVDDETEVVCAEFRVIDRVA